MMRTYAKHFTTDRRCWAPGCQCTRTRLWVTSAGWQQACTPACALAAAAADQGRRDAHRLNDAGGG